MALPPNIIDTAPIMQKINETPVSMLPQPLATLIQNAVGAVYVLVGGFFGIFIISIILRWWQGQKIKQKFEEINSRLTRLERKLDKLVKK
jgi:tetrahydromethanopterin S-methyltransferase subunit G